MNPELLKRLITAREGILRIRADIKAVGNELYEETLKLPPRSCVSEAAVRTNNEISACRAILQDAALQLSPTIDRE